MINYKLSAFLVVVVAAACLVAASADNVARKKELKAKLFGEENPLNVTEVLPLLKELSQINAEDLAKLPEDLKNSPEESEIRLLDGILKEFIAAGEVDLEKAKNLEYVNSLVFHLNSELENGVYFNIHPYLEAGIKAWTEANQKSGQKQ